MAGNEDSVKHNGPPEDEPLGRVGPTSRSRAVIPSVRILKDRPLARGHRSSRFGVGGSENA